MSPHVGNFVQDLVEMAKATERLPGLEAELSKAHSDIETYAKQVQDREMHIIELKAEIEAKNEFIRSLEVAKDQAETMFLELDEKTHKILGWIADSESSNRHIRNLLIPSLPQPEPVKVDIVDHAAENLAKSYDFPTGNVDSSGWNHDISPVDQGQGEALPTATDTLGTSHAAPIQSAETNIDASTTSLRESSPGLYSGLRYYDHPPYVPYDRWIEGGGTEEDYNWRPQPQPVSRSIF